MACRRPASACPRLAIAARSCNSPAPYGRPQKGSSHGVSPWPIRRHPVIHLDRRHRRIKGVRKFGPGLFAIARPPDSCRRKYCLRIKTETIGRPLSNAAENRRVPRRAGPPHQRPGSPLIPESFVDRLAVGAHHHQRINPALGEDAGRIILGEEGHSRRNKTSAVFWGCKGLPPCAREGVSDTATPKRSMDAASRQVVTPR